MDNYTSREDLKATVAKALEHSVRARACTKTCTTWCTRR